MHNYRDFITEEISPDLNNKAEVLKKLFIDNGFDKVTIQFDTQGYIVLTASFDYNDNIFTDRLDDYLEVLKFAKEMNSIAIETYESVNNRKSLRSIVYTFDFRNGNIPNYFKSLFGINKFKL